MGHIRLGTLQRTKKWQDVVALLETDAPAELIAARAAEAAELDLKRASDDPTFLRVLELLAISPHKARSPVYQDHMAELGFQDGSTGSVTDLLVGLADHLDRSALQSGGWTDFGLMSKQALLETLSDTLSDRTTSLFETTPDDVRQELARLSGGQEFGKLARSFFSNLTYRSLDYYLSRELAAHTGEDRRFKDDADRSKFDGWLKRHTFETARIVEDFAGGWYGKTVWQKDALTTDAIKRFGAYSFKKLRSELARRRAPA